MNPKIKVELLDNVFYTIIPTDRKNGSLYFLDYQISNSNSNSQQQMSWSCNVYTKNINLEKLVISIDKKYENICGIKYQEYVYKNIKDVLNKKYFEIITRLCKKHRSNKKYDINISELKEKKLDIGKHIISKVVSIGNFIATEGRIGPSHWAISNKNTYDYILLHLGDMNSYTPNIRFENGNLQLTNIQYLIDESIEDDIIIHGRKNDNTQTGVNCAILSDSDGHIYFDIYEDEYTKNLVMYFSFCEVGFEPENHFYVQNTRDIKYYRRKKIEKIRELYGKN